MPQQTDFQKQLQQAPLLEDLGLRIHAPHERNDQGAIEYTTVAEAIRHWAEDPFGERTFNFLTRAYGIPQDCLPKVLYEAGMQGYLDAKAQGRLVGMVSTQVLKPTYYYLSNAFALAEMSKAGIPTALIVGEYPQDKFHPANADKRSAFGKIDFPVGVREKQQTDGKIIRELAMVQIELRPYGIKHDDGTITRISRIEDATGYRCEQVLVQVVNSRGAENQNYTKETSYQMTCSEGNETKITELQTYYQAALGMHLDGLVNRRVLINKQEINILKIADPISITDFYRLLWIETIARLRKTGDLPTEEEMPMVIFNIPRLYTTLAKNAKPSKKFLDILELSSEKKILTEVLQVSPEEITTILVDGKDSFDAYLERRDLVRLENGLLAHTNGMLDPASYYPADMVWPDLLLVCSSCGGSYFVNRIKRAQKAHKHFNLAAKQVRLPDVEIPQLEKCVVHPTGKYFRLQVDTNEKVLELEKELVRLKNAKLSRSEYRKQVQQLTDQMKSLHEQSKADYFNRIEAFLETDYTQGNLVLPNSVAATFKELLKEIPETVKELKVYNTIKEIKGLDVVHEEI
jgi:hypothetical protein